MRIERDGNILVLKGPIPKRLFIELDQKLSYMYRSRDFRGNLKVEKRLLYNMLGEDDMCTTIGMWNDVSDVLKQYPDIGYEFVENTPPEYNHQKVKPDWGNVADLNFRAGQKEAINSIISHNGGIVCAPTGFGKTFLIGALCKLFPKAKIHVTTKSVEIANRIASDLKRLLPSVGMIGGGKNEANARVLVITSDSLHKAPSDADLFFYDECHQAAAESYTDNILTTYNYAKRIGFTATPTGRSDGADRVLSLLFGPVIFNMDYSQGVDLGLVVPIKVRWLTYSGPCAEAAEYKKPIYRKRHCIWQNEARNQLIADDVRTKYADDSVLILVETVEHAVYLHNLLPEFELCYANMDTTDLNKYIAKKLLPENYEPLSKKDRIDLCAKFLNGTVKKVISTDVWSTGVDFPSLSVVYSVSSRVSKILTTQGAGRVSRIFKGKEFGEVVDIQDLFADDFKGFSYRRYKTYKELGWEQEGFGTKKNGTKV